MPRVSGAKLVLLSVGCCFLVYWYGVLTLFRYPAVSNVKQQDYEDPDEPFRSAMEPLQLDSFGNLNGFEAAKYADSETKATEDASANMRHFSVISATYFSNSTRHGFGFDHVCVI